MLSYEELQGQVRRPSVTYTKVPRRTWRFKETPQLGQGMGTNAFPRFIIIIILMPPMRTMSRPVPMLRHPVNRRIFFPSVLTVPEPSLFVGIYNQEGDSEAGESYFHVVENHWVTGDYKEDLIMKINGVLVSGENHPVAS